MSVIAAPLTCGVYPSMRRPEGQAGTVSRTFIVHLFWEAVKMKVALRRTRRYNTAMAVLYRGKAFRKAHGVTQAQLSAGTGLRKATVVALERGQATPTTATLDRIITFFRAR